ncbi:hypothetical protein DJ71_20805 [Halorubrum sp. E3]|nr:hypothetical protein DJ71_20805 [Halorubrum sp. E3]
MFIIIIYIHSFINTRYLLLIISISINEGNYNICVIRVSIMCCSQYLSRYFIQLEVNVLI